MAAATATVGLAVTTTEIAAINFRNTTTEKAPYGAFFIGLNSILGRDRVMEKPHAKYLFWDFWLVGADAALRDVGGRFLCHLFKLFRLSTIT